MEEQGNRRLFFALWPDQICREQLLKLQRNLFLVGKQARYVPAANLHITLHFIGTVSGEQQSCLQEQARAVDAAGFDLTLDRPGYFRKSRVSWLGCDQPAGGLLALHQALAEQLGFCGFQAEKRHYNPHVTLIRKQQSSPGDPGVEAIDWRVNDFVLVESVSVTGGVRYDILERYSLN